MWRPVGPAHPWQAPERPAARGSSWSGGTLYTDVREQIVDADITRVWDVVEGIGGEHGWHSANWMWQIRGAMDRVAGGVGLRRGQRDPDHARSATPLISGALRPISRRCCCVCAPR